MTRSRIEYRVIHDLGRQYAAPMTFQDKDDALNVIEGQRRLAKSIGQEHLADGWHLEKRTITEWQKDTDWLRTALGDTDD